MGNYALDYYNGCDEISYFNSTTLNCTVKAHQNKFKGTRPAKITSKTQIFSHPPPLNCISKNGVKICIFVTVWKVMNSHGNK